MGTFDRDDKRKKRSDRNPASSRYRSGGDIEFVNRELTNEETTAYRSWRSDVEQVSELWMEVLEGGYRVNTKYDDYSSSCAAFIFPPEGSENSGLALTGRGGNPYRAVAEALFKHQWIFKGVWSLSTLHPSRQEDPDF